MLLGNSSNDDSDGVDFSVPYYPDKSKTSEENEKKNNERDFVKVFSDYKRQSAGVISEAKKKEVYLKPSVRRKLKSELARKKRNKKNKNNYRFGK